VVSLLAVDVCIVLALVRPGAGRGRLARLLCQAEALLLVRVILLVGRNSTELRSVGPEAVSRAGAGRLARACGLGLVAIGNQDILNSGG